MLLSYTIVDFHLFYDGAVDIQVCDTQVTVKACGPLILFEMTSQVSDVAHGASCFFCGYVNQSDGFAQACLFYWICCFCN